MDLDLLVVVLPIFSLVLGASIGAWGVHWIRDHRPRWWPGYRRQ